ncbi:hypothetical protein LJB89_01370, partial [Tyzzerella sp. OttesenSCG-928-J15]|nr:hypothetical protein [Tyzzerella sp. OttesenSCG-928-J15]
MEDALNKLAEMRGKSIGDFAKEELVDIQNIRINPSPEKNERIISYLNEVKNPYVFKVGDVAVQVKFANNNVFMKEKLENILLD